MFTIDITKKPPELCEFCAPSGECDLLNKKQREDDTFGLAMEGLEGLKKLSSTNLSDINLQERTAILAHSEIIGEIRDLGMKRGCPFGNEF